MPNNSSFTIDIDRDKIFDFLSNAKSTDEAMSTLGHSIVGAMLANADDWKDHVFFGLVGLEMKKAEGTHVSNDFLSAVKEMAGSLNRFVDMDDEDDILFKLDDAKHDLKVFKEQAEKEGLFQVEKDTPGLNP